MKIQKIITGPLAVNTYIFSDNGEAFVVDPGGNGERIFSIISAENLKLKAVLLTHGHFDHTGAVYYLQECGAAVIVGVNEEKFVLSSDNLAALYDAAWRPFNVDFTVKDGDKFFLCSNEITVIETPGHTPGGVCYKVGNYLFSGDTLFAGGIGRTDLPGGNYSELIMSLKKLFVITDDLVVLPGHGDESTLLREKGRNPYA